MIAWCIRIAMIALLIAAPAHAAPGTPEPLSPAARLALEGEWHGVRVDVNADRLCTPQSPPVTPLSLEFEKTGGLAYVGQGIEDTATRRRIVTTSTADGLILLALEGRAAPLAFRQDAPNLLALVSQSATLGMPVDVMVFKRCKAPADRSQMALDAESLAFLSADMPSAFAYFVDQRIAAKIKDPCHAQHVQYVYFALVGPAELRASRWNSFALTDALAAGRKPSFAVDTVHDWDVVAARQEGRQVILSVRSKEQPSSTPQTLTIVRDGAKGIRITEWGRSYQRCTGFDTRS